ncbi:MAG: CPBP family intramembrane glutamic endopeptidase [Candidatus Tyrphobacter sp.]
MSEGLRVWLRFDETRAAEAEEAYAEFIVHSKPGVALCFAVVLAFVGAIVCAVVFTFEGIPRGRIVGPIIAIFGSTFYGVLMLAVIRSPLPVLRRVLAGAVSVPRAIILAFGLGLLCVLAEGCILAILVALFESHRVQSGSTGVDYFGGGVLWGVILLLLAAPVAEEFLMQGWLQTRLARLGPFGAGVATTILFVLMHAPTSILDWTRGVALGTAAWFRGATRSLLGAIVVHATNNAVLVGLLLLARETTHR